MEAGWAPISAVYPVFNLPTTSAIDSKACSREVDPRLLLLFPNGKSYRRRGTLFPFQMPFLQVA